MIKLAFCLFIALPQLAALAAESPWSRVVVIGASASGGFVLSEPFGGPETQKCKLHNYLDAAIIPAHSPVKNFGTALFFLSPDAMAAQEVNSATNAKPTLVVAVDFMFWFCYGEQDSDAARAQHFEFGLKLLEQLPCPIIVGDIPDASSATNSGIIGSEQVPSESARRAANARLKKWAAAHPRVTIVPLAEFMRAVKADEAIKLHGIMLPAGTTRSLLQDDGLHPTSRGAAILSLGIWDAYFKAHPKISSKDINWDPNQVLRTGLKKATPETQ
ncbi:MAG TPA: SGNH/GDSL hydrolase family protein [Verrucomicrobiae bacterium]|nr:SGNH/GDSL hydrolase family protein [Verrucomicrobiae bacterium]